MSGEVAKSERVEREKTLSLLYQLWTESSLTRQYIDYAELLAWSYPVLRTVHTVPAAPADDRRRGLHSGPTGLVVKRSWHPTFGYAAWAFLFLPFDPSRLLGRWRWRWCWTPAGTRFRRAVANGGRLRSCPAAWTTSGP